MTTINNTNTIKGVSVREIGDFSWYPERIECVWNEDYNLIAGTLVDYKYQGEDRIGVVVEMVEIDAEDYNEDPEDYGTNVEPMDEDYKRWIIVEVRGNNTGNYYTCGWYEDSRALEYGDTVAVTSRNYDYIEHGEIVEFREDILTDHEYNNENPEDYRAWNECRYEEEYDTYEEDEEDYGYYDDDEDFDEETEKTTWIMAQLLDDNAVRDYVWQSEQKVLPGDIVMVEPFYHKAEVIEVYQDTYSTDDIKAFPVEE